MKPLRIRRLLRPTLTQVLLSAVVAVLAFVLILLLYEYARRPTLKLFHLYSSTPIRTEIIHLVYEKAVFAALGSLAVLVLAYSPRGRSVYRHVFRAASLFRPRRPSSFLLALVKGGAWCLLGLVHLVLLASLALPVYALAVYRAGEADPENRRLVQTRCDECHSYQRVRHAIRPRKAWAYTVERMSNYQETPFTDEEKKGAVLVLSDAQSYTDRQYYQGKCLGYCHTFRRIMARSRPLEEWRRVVRRIETRCPMFLGPLESEQIVSHLSRVEARRGGDKRSERSPREEVFRATFEEKCGTCHLLGIVTEYAPSPDVWKPILRRMGTKSPGFLSEEEALSIEPYILSLKRDRFSEEFPHSTVFTGLGAECN